VKGLLGPEGREELRRLARARSLLAFDFDGTLAPIVPRPDVAAMRSTTRTLLAAVAVRWPCAVISGRRLSDLQPRFEGIPVRWLVGNHGAEGGAPVPRAARLRREVSEWRERLRAGMDGRPGIRVEDKGMSVAVHFRDSPHRAAARARILELAMTFEGARLVPGKCVVDVLPAEAPDKGSALAHLVRIARPDRAFFAGDDASDEDAFARELPVPLTTVRVGGSGATRARFGLAGQRAVDRMLRALLAASD
jgi:trehalose 6-phosphate phosphatase